MSDWIPIKTRPMTEEESTYYRDWAEYGAEIFDCPLPEDGQEVLVSWGNNVCVDIFVRDTDGCYFEDRDIDEVTAWMRNEHSIMDHSNLRDCKSCTVRITAFEH